MKHLCYLTTGLLLLALPALGGPPVIDGSAATDTLYGTELAIQDTQTGFGDANLGRPDICNGSEIDGLYAVVYQGNLYIVVAGNFETNSNKLELFFDTRAGGQNRLLATNPGVANTKLLRMSDDGTGNGLTFQLGFEADFWVSASCFGDPTVVDVDYAELYVSPSNLGAIYYCGQGAPKCATAGGALTGGDVGAPAILATVDNSNVLGVTGGFGAGDGTGVATGFEFAIPLSALGNPTGAITVTAFINGQQHDFVSNQVLGGLAGLVADNLGEPRNVNFQTVAFGIQMPVTIPAAPTPTGACCIGTACSIKTQAQCTASAGTYKGDDTNCDGNPCNATAQGRCCIDDGFGGQCLIREQAQCNTLGGTWAGGGTTCDGCPCLLPPTGACCIGGVCSLKTEADCAAAAGSYVGNYTNCNNAPCDSGACCVDIACSVVMRFQCTGRFIGAGTDCGADPCSLPTIMTPYAAGSMQTPVWQPALNPMTETAPGSHIWTITFTGLTPNGRYEWKVTDGTWTNTLPSANSWLYADGSGNITLTYDGNFYADGWSPNRDRLGVSFDPGTWTAVGDFLSELGGTDWNNADPAGAMAGQGGGIYKREFTGIPPAAYNWKAVKTGTWDSISWDARSVNTANMQFTTAASADTVKLWVNVLVGDVKVDIVPAVTTCIGDLNCDGLINFGDINPFVLYLSNFATWQSTYAGCNPANGDINCDGTFGQGAFGDINPFVSVMTQCGTGCPCPGPVSCP
jgi:hypothetical protein